MPCNICANSKNVFACTKCAYRVCESCITDGCAPTACMQCTPKNLHGLRSRDDVVPRDFVEIFKKAMHDFSTASQDKKVGTMHNLMKVIKEYRFFILKNQHFRNVVARKMHIVSLNSTNAEWIKRYPWIMGEAKEIYDFFRWHPLSVKVGVPYTRIPDTQPVLAQ